MTQGTFPAAVLRGNCLLKARLFSKFDGKQSQKSYSLKNPTGRIDDKIGIIFMQKELWKTATFQKKQVI